MKNVLSFLLLFLMYSFAYASGYGSSTGGEQDIKLNLKAIPVVSGQDSKPVDDLFNKHRIPTFPITCIIDENGVSIQMDTTPEIISYEIYDADGMLICSVGDEETFIQTLFSMSGDYTVVFRTQEYAYIGSVEL